MIMMKGAIKDEPIFGDFLFFRSYDEQRMHSNHVKHRLQRKQTFSQLHSSKQQNRNPEILQRSYMYKSRLNYLAM